MRSCNDIAPLLLAEPDGTLSTVELARLETHVGACADCRRQRALLAAAPAALRAASAAIPTPNAQAEWAGLRSRLRATKPAPAPARAWSLPRFTWGMRLVGFGAAAAFAIGVYLQKPPDRAPTSQSTTLARADFVQAENASSTLVYVDQESGWLIVWADSGGTDRTTI